MMDYVNIYGTQEYMEYVQQNYGFLENEKYFVSEETIQISEDFSVVTRNYMHFKDMRRWRLSWNWIKRGGENIYCFKTIDPPIKPFNKLIYHKNGHRYYPFHIDVFGISYLDVDTLEAYHYIPRGRKMDTESICGESFVITDIAYDKCSNLIAYSGCYWAWPDDVMVGDFTEPMNFKPELISMHAVLRQQCGEYSDVNLIGWKDDAIWIKIETDNVGEVKEVCVNVEVLKSETTRRATYENVRYHCEEA